MFNGKLKGNNVVNLSKRMLSKPGTSLLSKTLKFIPASNILDKAKLKTEREAFG